MGAAIGVGLATSAVSTGLDIYQNYNEKVRVSSANKLASQTEIGEILINKDNKNYQIKNEILTNRFEAENIRKNFQIKNNLQDQVDRQNINTQKASMLTSGVELSGTALDVLESVERRVETERFYRSKLANDEADSRQLIADTLLYDIERNNITANYQIEKNKQQLSYANRNLDNKFAEDSFLSIVKFGLKAGSKLA